MTQLARESAERTKIETLLRELLDARRSRKSEQLSADRLALFAAALQAREQEAKPNADDDATPGGSAAQPPKKSGAPAAATESQAGAHRA